MTVRRRRVDKNRWPFWVIGTVANGGFTASHFAPEILRSAYSEWSNSDTSPYFERRTYTVTNFIIGFFYLDEIRVEFSVTNRSTSNFNLPTSELAIWSFMDRSKFS
jgi:hypothetical protein